VNKSVFCYALLLLLSSRRLGRAETDGEELTLLLLVSSRPLGRAEMDGEELTSKGNKRKEERECERERERKQQQAEKKQAAPRTTSFPLVQNGGKEMARNETTAALLQLPIVATPQLYNFHH
jgi:hypothetical protein